MFISHKANVIQEVDPDEWQCRRTTKGMSGSEYWAWLATITDSDGVITYPSETFTIIEVTDENVQTRLVQLGDYTSMDGVYNIKYYAAKRNAEEIKDIDGNSTSPKTYVSSHFVGQDDTKNARILADEWTLIRTERDRLLTSTDWTQGNDTPLSDANTAKWTTYRGKLRTLPADQSSKTKYSQVTWPTKP